MVALNLNCSNIKISSSDVHDNNLMKSLCKDDKIIDADADIDTPS